MFYDHNEPSVSYIQIKEGEKREREYHKDVRVSSESPLGKTYIDWVGIM